jgi:hypothetical protein
MLGSVCSTRLFTMSSSMAYCRLLVEAFRSWWTKLKAFTAVSASLQEAAAGPGPTSLLLPSTASSSVSP